MKAFSLKKNIQNGKRPQKGCKGQMKTMLHKLTLLEIKTFSLGCKTQDVCSSNHKSILL